MDIDISCMTWLPILCDHLGSLFHSKPKPKPKINSLLPNDSSMICHTSLSSNGHCDDPCYNNSSLHETSLLHLPDDIIVNIFSRLDLRYAFQCSHLCRPLYTILASPYFLSVHKLRATPNLIIQCFERQPKPVKTCAYTPDVVLHCVDVSGNIVPLRIKFNVSYMWPDFDCRPFLVGSYNGLLLFENHCLYNSVFFIWNPLTQEQVALIAPEPAYSVCGFYFHPPTGEYRVLYVRYRNSDPEFLMLGLRTKLLRLVSKFSLVPCARRPPVVLNGTLHWTVSEDLSDSGCHASSSSFCSKLILLFDIYSEVFVTIPHPGIENCSSRRHTMMHLLEMEGQLCLCDVTAPTDLDVWVLQEKQVWIRTHKISTKSIVPPKLHFVHSLSEPTLEAFYNWNDEILLKYHSRRLYSYHQKLNTFMAINTIHFGDKSLTSIVSHSNSTASLYTEEIIFLASCKSPKRLHLSE